MSQSNLMKDEFQILLDNFHEIIKGMPPIEKVKDHLLELKEKAINNNEITFWQKDSIIARCNNYLNNDYGSQVESKKVSEYFQKRMEGKSAK